MYPISFLQVDQERIIQSSRRYPIRISIVMNRRIRDFLPIWKQDVKVRSQTHKWVSISKTNHVYFVSSIFRFSICLFFIVFFKGWHYCDIDGRQASFLCPNGTQFSQAVFVCDWWFNVRCDLSPRLYAINARLYQRPKVNPTRPHRIITKQLVDDIFNK